MYTHKHIHTLIQFWICLWILLLPIVVTCLVVCLNIFHFNYFGMSRFLFPLCVWKVYCLFHTP